MVPNRRQRAAEAEPVAGRQIAFGDGDEARKTRLRREQIVIAGVEPAIGDPISDRQQLPLRVEQKAELHCIDQRPRALAQRGKAAAKARRPPGRTA